MLSIAAAASASLDPFLQASTHSSSSVPESTLLGSPRDWNRFAADNLEGLDGSLISHFRERIIYQHTMDRISDLPDHVLSYILSKLSIKDMLRTSLLSRKWLSDLWSLWRDLNFDRHTMLGSEKELLEAGYVTHILDTDLGRTEFVKRVDQFVKNFHGAEINSFKVEFNLNCEQSSSIDQWISFAISRGVTRIDLLLCYNMKYFLKWGTLVAIPFGPIEQYINLAIWRFRSVDGKLTGFIKGLPLDIEVRKFYKFPFGLFSESHPSNLRSLKLDEARIDGTMMTSMITKCLQLEELKLEACMFESSTLEIASSSLRLLEVIVCFYVSSEEEMFPIELNSLDCPKLTSFEFHKCGLDSLSISTPKVKRIFYSYKRNVSEVHHALALFATLPRLEILELITDFEVFSLSRIEVFKHLTELNLVCSNVYNGNEIQGIPTSWILTIIGVSPHLHKLSVEFLLSFSSDQEDIKDYGSFYHDELKVVEMGGCVGDWYEIELAMNVLKYVHNLDRLVLSPYSVRGKPPDDAWFEVKREMVREELQFYVIGQTQLILI